MKDARLIRLPEVARRYDVSERTIRRSIGKHDGSIAPPAFDHPWRWRVADVDAHINGNEVSDQRRRRARRLRLAERDRHDISA